MNWAVRLRERAKERDWVMTVLSVLGVIGLGVLVGSQYMLPDKRILALAAATLLLGVAWRLDLVSGVGILILALPFPRYTSFGTTSLAFVLLLMLVWLLRYTQREAAGPRRTPLDAPIALLILSYVLSFYNVEPGLMLNRALLNSGIFIACVLTYYLIVSNVRTEADLKRIHLFQAVSIGLIYLFCVWELLYPGSVLVPGWIDLRNPNTDLTAINRSFRIGGPWFDYELLSEFAAMNMIFFIFMIAQARSTTRRVIFAGFLMAGIMVEFSTVTRGGTTALVVGLAYLLYLVRRRVNVVPLTILAVVSTLVIVAISVLLRRYTTVGDISERFGHTAFINGIPDSRAQVWPQAWERWMLHPLLGGGPYYSADRGLRLWYWPHNLPLYIGCCFGFFGFGVFTWLIVRLWKLSKPLTDRLDDPNYAAAFHIVARVQLVVFLVDEMKIEYLRNPNYQFQPWVMFAILAAAAAIVKVPATAPAAVRIPAAPRLTSATARS